MHVGPVNLGPGGVRVPQLARLQVSIFWSLFVSSTTLAGCLGPRRLCRFDGKPDLLAELAEAAAIFNLSIMMTEEKRVNSFPKNFAAHFLN